MDGDNGQNKTTITIDVDERPLFRVRKPLWYKDEIIQPGSLHRLEKLDRAAVATLLAKNTIAEVQPPPLSVLPGWSVRSKKLAEAGVETAMQLLGADPGQVAAYMRVKPATVERWQEEVLVWLTAPESRG